jgi:purine-binding chemotaxis protein CheW
MTDSSNPAERLPPRGGAADREYVGRVLRERARALARPLAGDRIEATADLVTLELGGRGYAIEANVVREVCAVRELTPLPTAPPFVLGITNIRGKIIAVLDLAGVLGHGAVARPSGRAIIVEIGGIEIGVDARHCGVARVPHRRLAPASREAQRRYLKAVGNDDLGVLDLERIVADTRQTAASLASGAVR